MRKREFLSAMGALNAQVALCWFGTGSSAALAQTTGLRLDPNGRLRFGIDYDVVRWDPHISAVTAVATPSPCVSRCWPRPRWRRTRYRDRVRSLP